LLGLHPLSNAKLIFCFCAGSQLCDESLGFCHVVMSQVLTIQTLATFARSKTSRLLDETHKERVPKVPAEFSGYQRARLPIGKHHYRD
jgi:hypothetical protein